MTSLIFLIFCLIIKLIVSELNKPVVSDVDQLIKRITQKKPVKYISNGVELKTNFTEHYFDILDMEKGRLFDREMILTQIKKQQFYLYFGKYALAFINIGCFYEVNCSNKTFLLTIVFFLRLNLLLIR